MAPTPKPDADVARAFRMRSARPHDQTLQPAANDVGGVVLQVGLKKCKGSFFQPCAILIRQGIADEQDSGVINPLEGRMFGEGVAHWFVAASVTDQKTPDEGDW